MGIGTVKRLLLFLTFLILLTACRSAGHSAGRSADEWQAERFVAPDRFEWLEPSSERWKRTVNHRDRWNTRVEYRDRTHDAALFVRARPLSPRQETYPLEILAELVFVRKLASDGGMPEIDDMVRIALDEREAVAVTGSRYDRPVRTRYALVVMRSQGFLVLMGYSSPPQHFEMLGGDFERFLRQFKVLLPGPFDPYVLGDLPMGAPSPSFLNLRSEGIPKRPRTPALPITPQEDMDW